MIQINDTTTDKGLILIPAQQAYVEMDLASMPSAERERLGLIRQVSKELKVLSAEADDVLEEREFEGQRLIGFRTGEKTIWVDPASEELVRIELAWSGARMVMTNFRLDPPDLDASQFVTTPPDGYTRSVQGAISSDVTDTSEQDQVEFLRFMAAFRVDGQFPEGINPLEVLTLQERGLMREDPSASPAEADESGRRFAVASQRAVMFMMGMQPSQEWHYRGAGIELGKADTPIAWWKSAPDAYRVIWADLTLTDESDWDPPQG